MSKENSELINCNSEFLFIYDAEMTNPNGDPDNENKPRMDTDKGINLVTDVRLKRYIRDYLEEYDQEEIYLTNPEGFVLNATDRLKFWKWRKENPKETVDLSHVRGIKDLKIKDNDLIEGFIDVRLFGVTCPIKADDKNAKGSSITFTGPIQINWGKSFNIVELVDSSAITTHLSSEKGSQGSIGQDYRLYYSLIGFHGQISAKRGKITKLTKNDIQKFDNALIKSIPNLATRSKIGQQPRFYLKVNYNVDSYIFGDFRKFIKISETKRLRNIKDYELDVTDLISNLVLINDKINSIQMWIDKDLKIIGDFKTPFEKKLSYFEFTKKTEEKNQN